MTKTKRVIGYTLFAERPFSVKLLMEKADCSASTVSRALDAGAYVNFWAWSHDGHGNFSRVFFPFQWTREECMVWLKAQTKNGRTRASVHAWGIPFC